MGDPVWYVMRSQPRLEVKASAALERGGLSVYLPMARRWRRIRHKKGKGARERVEVPLFPGYFFAAFQGAIDWEVIHRAAPDGVAGFVTVKDTPARISAREIERLKAAEDMGCFDQTDEPIRLVVGGEVVITSGPLDGYVAVVERVPKAAGKPLAVSIVGKLADRGDDAPEVERMPSRMSTVVRLDSVRALA